MTSGVGTGVAVVTAIVLVVTVCCHCSLLPSLCPSLSSLNTFCPPVFSSSSSKATDSIHDDGFIWGEQVQWEQVRGLIEFHHFVNTWLMSFSQPLCLLTAPQGLLQPVPPKPAKCLSFFIMQHAVTAAPLKCHTESTELKIQASDSRYFISHLCRNWQSRLMGTLMKCFLSQQVGCSNLLTRETKQLYSPTQEIKPLCSLSQRVQQVCGWGSCTLKRLTEPVTHTEKWTLRGSSRT